MRKQMEGIDHSKSTGWDSIPPKIIKIAATELSVPIANLVNASFKTSCFPRDLKKAEVLPLFKSKNNLDRQNYRPVSVLPCISKLFERVYYNQLYDHFNCILSVWLAAFRRRYGCNHVLSRLLENTKLALDGKEYVGLILMDLSKAFDCLPHDLLLNKLYTYGLNKDACVLIKSYLSNRSQRVKIGPTKSDWLQLRRGVPQGSVLGPLLFNIFFNDFFYSLSDNCVVYNYADDNTLSYSHKDIGSLKDRLEMCAQMSLDWFNNNNMKANPDKFQAIIFSPKHETVCNVFHINGTTITSLESVKLLGVTIDEKLNFDAHISMICSRASRQLNALQRISKYLDRKGRVGIHKAFIMSNFRYCSDVWHFCSRKSTYKLEKINKRALRIVENNYLATYTDLLELAKCSSLYLDRIKSIAFETFKYIHGINPQFLSSTFESMEHHYETRGCHNLKIPKVSTEKNGKQSLGFEGVKIWNCLPDYIKQSCSIEDLKINLKYWDGPQCVCGNCIQCMIPRL